MNRALRVANAWAKSAGTMLITQTAEYAFRAMACLAGLEAGATLKSSQISSATGVPVHFLAKVMRRLVVAGLVDSQKGHGGGFALAKPASVITFADIMAASGIESDDHTTAAAVAKYPDKFVGFAYVDPRRADAMEMLRHAVEDLGLKGVKFGPIYNGVPLSNPRLVPVYEYCQKNNIPLTMHMGTTFARKAPVELGRAVYVDDVAIRYPDLTMILAQVKITNPRGRPAGVKGLVSLDHCQGYPIDPHPSDIHRLRDLAKNCISFLRTDPAMIAHVEAKKPPVLL